MIVKDLTKFQSDEGKVSFINVIQATLKHGLSWGRNREYQEDFITSIQNILDDKNVMLRSLTLPGEEDPIPLVLVSPTGLTVINPQNIDGVFQARDDTWNAIDRVGELVPVDPNPIQKTQSYAAAVERHLERENFRHVPLESVLAFVSASTHVDSKHPAVRILPFDAIKNFARQVNASELILDIREKEQLVHILSEGHSPQQVTSDLEEEALPVSPSAQQPKIVQNLNNVTGKLNFSKRQWILLASMLVVQIFLLIVFIFLVILSS